MRAVTPAPNALSVRTTVPGSKSEANRALVCAGLADGVSVLRGIPGGDDTQAMIAGLRSMGAECVDEVMDGVPSLRMNRPVSLDRVEEVRVDARLAGTTSRFLTALGALGVGKTVVDGELPLRVRPIGDLLDALRTLGASVECLGGVDSLPVRVSRGALRGGNVRVPGGTSSQFVSALALIGPLLDGGLSIEVTGDAVSTSYVRLTLEMMRRFGIDCRQRENTIEVVPSRYVAADFTIAPDASSATYPAAAAAIVGGTVRLSGLVRSASQPDSQFPELLGRMGCLVVNDGYDVIVSRDSGSPLHGIEINMREMSDSVPALAVVAACAGTPTTITGVGFIRGKESDRLGDLAAELARLGADVEVLDDGLRIAPSALHGGQVHTYHDHRLAMAFGVLGLAVPGVVIEDPGVVSKSWPEFWADLERWAK